MRYWLAALQVILFFLSFYGVVSAQVVINEVAWMGTVDSANDEWIELYNTSDNVVSLEGWRLVAIDGAPDITLSGSVAGRAFYILERTDDDTVSGVTADLIYTGSLGNTGEYLQLKDESGNVIDSVNQSDGWQGGDNTTKETMQKNTNGWFTAVATPRAENNQSDDESNDNSDETNTSSGGSSSNSSTTEQDDNVTVTEYEKEDPQYIAELDIPSRAVIGDPLSIYGKVKREDRTQFRGRYVWNFGDGSFYEFHARNRDDFSIEHVYEYPGSYTIQLQYFPSTFPEDKPILTRRQMVTVMKNPIKITNILGDGSVEMENTSSQEINISDWSLQSNEQIFHFSEGTFFTKNTSIVLSQTVHGLSIHHWSTLSLVSPSGALVDTYTLPSESLAVTTHQNFIETPNQNNREVTSSSEEIRLLPEDQITSPENSTVIMRQDDTVTSSARQLIILITFISLIFVGILGVFSYWYSQKKNQSDL